MTIWHNRDAPPWIKKTLHHDHEMHHHEGAYFNDMLLPQWQSSLKVGTHKQLDLKVLSPNLMISGERTFTSPNLISGERTKSYQVLTARDNYYQQQQRKVVIMYRMQ